jgi:PTS system mannose-specific IIA component
MVGIVIVAHGQLAEELIRTTTLIAEVEMPPIIPVSIAAKDDLDEIRAKITQAIKKADEGDGVIVFTDLFGGSPNNIALNLLAANKLEVISGVNLPMLADLVYLPRNKTLAEIADQLAETGRSSIRLASQYLRGK